MPEELTAGKRDVSIHEARRILKRLTDEAVASRSDAYLIAEENYHVRALAETAQANFVDKNRTQMRNLERIALSALTFGDVVNFVKSQTGRSIEIGKQWRKGDFGPRLHAVLWDTIRNDATRQADNIFKALNGRVKKALKEKRYQKLDLERELRLHLTRAYVRHLVAHYNYLVSVEAA